MTSDKKNEIFVQGAVSPRKLRSLKPAEPLDRFGTSLSHPFHAKLAQELCGWPAIRDIGVWGAATKATFRQVMAVPGLEELFVNYFHKHGSFDGMPIPASLHTVRAGWLSSKDIRNVLKLPGLRTLSAQHAMISNQTLAVLVDHPRLENLDIEGSNLNDAMAADLSKSETIVELEIGATDVGKAGLQRICEMRQLKALDIWALKITEDDLEHLQALSNLEYLSVGGYEGQAELTVEGVLPRIRELPSLKRIWLDGIHIPKAEFAQLKAPYEQIQVT